VTDLALVLVIGGLLMLVGVLAWCLLRIVRWAWRQPLTRQVAQRESVGVPFGALPDLGPVGRLGTLDLDSDLGHLSERDLG
jgi:hypothetical protein